MLQKKQVKNITIKFLFLAKLHYTITKIYFSTSISLLHQAVIRHGRGQVYNSLFEFNTRGLWHKGGTIDLKPLLHGQRIIKYINSVKNENIFIYYVFI